MITKQDVFRFLEKMGIKKTDTVLVHSSMRAIGGVEGGCDGLIDAFKAYLSEGLFIVPSHTWSTVNKENPYFDVKKSTPCVGALSCVAAARADGVRSLHPTHSVVAFGKEAAEFVQGEEKTHTPAPAGGVWARLYDRKAKILLVGVGHDKNTFFHAVDEMIDMPNRLVEEAFTAVITDKDGKICKTEMHPHKGAVSLYYPNYKKALETCGCVTYGHLGDALVYCCDAEKCADIIKRIWSRADHDVCEKTEEIPAEYYAEL